jgi:hypothetical protein
MYHYTASYNTQCGKERYRCSTTSQEFLTFRNCYKLVALFPSRPFLEACHTVKIRDLNLLCSYILVRLKFMIS